MHPRPRHAETKVDFAQDTIDGKPICKHCRKVFLNWRSFTLHRGFNVCNAPESRPASFKPDVPYSDDQDLESMEVSAQHSDLLGRAQVFASEADYDSVMHDRPMCDFMKSHCSLCSKHVVSAKALTAHLRSNHPGQMQEAIALGIQRTRQHTGNLSPCSFCNTNSVSVSYAL